MFSRVCTSERACAMRWNRVERKVKWSRPASRCVSVCMCVYVERVRKSAIGGGRGDQMVLYACKRDFELAILFNVSFFLISLCLFAACNFVVVSHIGIHRDKVKRNKCYSYFFLWNNNYKKIIIS